MAGVVAMTTGGGVVVAQGVSVVGQGGMTSVLQVVWAAGAVQVEVMGAAVEVTATGQMVVVAAMVMVVVWAPLAGQLVTVGAHEITVVRQVSVMVLVVQVWWESSHLSQG